MRPTHRLVAATASLAGAAVLFASPAIAARPGSLGEQVSDPRFSGPGVDISVTIPTGWHQIGAYHQIPQMVYPETCSVGIECAFAIARVFSGQESSAQIAAEAIEQGIAGSPGIQSATVTNKGPVQVAGRPGYHVRFTYSNQQTTKFQAEAAAVETGPTSSDGVRTSVIIVTVSDLAGAPPPSVIDQIVGSAQLTAR